MIEIETLQKDQPGRNLLALFPPLRALDLAVADLGGTDLPLLQAMRTLLARMEREDPALRDHGQRTAVYAIALGQAIGLPQRDLADLYCAALLHDIGKLLLPKAILSKPGPLSLDEYALVQCHPRLSVELLGDMPALRVPAVLIAHHHERWDGTGYPYGVPGRFTPLGSRILAVADVFDALTSDRPYAPPRDPQAAVRLIQTIAGTHLDPDLVQSFAGLVEGLGEALPDDPDQRIGRDVPPALCPSESGRLAPDEVGVAANG
ncbi:HD-GYP domain-containing protein [Nitrospira sp. Kam-Ns4a]